MQRWLHLVLLLVMAFDPTAFNTAAAEVNFSGPTIYSGICDGSAGVFLGDELMIVANDEDNLLRVYAGAKGGSPLQEIDLNDFPGFSKKNEADIEAAATLGDLVFWIGSHARTKKGKESPSRQVLFATKFTVRNGRVETECIGKPYGALLADFSKAPELASYRLGEASKLTPEEDGGLNIEGLSATPQGHLLIGFRNPIPGGKALLVSLLNPRQVLDGERAQLGAPHLLDLGGMGIRDIVLTGSDYLIVAGPHDGGAASRLYRWDGKSQPRLLGRFPKQMNPEAVMIPPGAAPRIEVLTDNGSASVDGKDCKELKNSAQKYFHRYSIHLR